MWKERNPSLPYIRQLAVQQLHNLERKLERNPELAENYRNTVKEYLDRGYAQKLTSDESNKCTNITNYIRHHYVTSQIKPDKIYVVFDTGGKYHKTCLNDHLLKGPVLLNILVSILM